jgi:hypothetical protein
MGVEGYMVGQHDTYRGPSWVSHLLLIIHAKYRVYNKHRFSYNYFVTGEDE